MQKNLFLHISFEMGKQQAAAATATESTKENSKIPFQHILSRFWKCVYTHLYKILLYSLSELKLKRSTFILYRMKHISPFIFILILYWNWLSSLSFMENTHQKNKYKNKSKKKKRKKNISEKIAIECMSLCCVSVYL